MKRRVLAFICTLAMIVSAMPVTGLHITKVMAASDKPDNLQLKVQNNKDIISWDEVSGASSYKIYKSDSRFGTYSLVNTTTERSFSCEAKQGTYYKVSAELNGKETEKSSPVSEETALFGENVLIYSPEDNNSEIQREVDRLFTQQEEAQFDENRYAVMFKKGKYSDNLKVNVGFYTQVAGLGALPTDTAIGNIEVSANWLFANNGETKNATQNFWRSVENLTVNSNVMWAVSQATAFRRMNVKGNVTLVDNGSWASGGYMSDSKISNTLDLASQQQWFNRNTEAKSFQGTSWNLVDVGCVGDSDRVNNTSTVQNTVISETPGTAERPYLVCDDNNNYSVFVPAYKENTVGISWANGKEDGKSIPIEQFYVAKPDTDTADTINAALKSGKHLLLTPGIYRIDKPIEITNADTVVLGLGYATLEPINGTEAMKIADVDGVRVAGLLFEAGHKNSETLLRVGEEKTGQSHAANPVVLSDIFFRVGGANHTQTVSCDTCVQINSNNVIGDNFWVWRADHGWDASVGWDENICYNGLIVNGDNVTIYALMVEHFEEYQTIWNGNGGKMYFYQSEMPYDVPSTEAYMSHNGTVEGWASYKVADTVETHEAYGLGMYSFYTGATIDQERAMEVPNAKGVKVTNALTHNLANSSQVKHVINSAGTSTKDDYCPTIKLYNDNYVGKITITPSGAYTNAQMVTMNCETEGAQVYYTTDGSTPSKTNGTLYTKSFEVNETTTVKAKAFVDGKNPSETTANIVIDDKNIALGKTVTSSSVREGSGNRAMYAIDGDNSTRWESEWQDNEWLKVDLGGMYEVTGFKIIWDWAAARDYNVQISEDGANWSNIYKKTSGSSNATVKYTFKNKKRARYIRIYCTARVSEYGNSIVSFEVYGNTINNVKVADKPDTLQIQSVKANDVTLNWRASGNAKYYNVYRATGISGKYLQINKAPVSENTYTDKVNVLNASKYSYKVSAVSEGGYESALSDFVVLSTRDNYGKQAFDYSPEENTTQDPEEPKYPNESIVDDEEELNNQASEVTDAEGRHEAEDSDLVGGGSISTVDKGSWNNFSGLSYVENLNDNTKDNIHQYISFKVKADKSGIYRITVGYTGTDAGTKMGVAVDNGKWKLIETIPSENWCLTEAISMEIKLNKGLNTVKVSGAVDGGWLCLDYVDIKFAREEATTGVHPETTRKPVETTGKAKPIQVKGTTVKSVTKKKSSTKAKISLKKVSGAKSYKIQISTSKKFKKVLVTKTVKKANFTIKSKKIKNKKNMYVRVQVCKIIKGKKYYSSWSKAKKFKIKK